MFYTVLFGLLLAHIMFCIVYMLFTTSIGSAFSTYRVMHYIYMVFTASLGLPPVHIELFSIDIYAFYSLFGSAFSTYRVMHTRLGVHALYSLLGLSLACMFYTFVVCLL